MASYFDDFLDMGDTQPMKVDDLPDAFKDLATLGNLPPEVAGNTLTSVLAQPQMSPQEAQRQEEDRRMVEGIQGLAQVLPINDPLNIRSPLSGYPQGMQPDLQGVTELFETLGQERTAGPFEKELKEVRKATEKAAKDFEKFQQSQNVADAAVDRANFAFRTEDPNAFLPPSYGQVDTFGVPTPSSPQPPPFQLAYNPADAGIAIRNAERANLALSLGAPQYSGGISTLTNVYPSALPTPFLDTGPEYTGGVLPPSQLLPSNNRFSAISNVLSNLDFGIGGSGRFLYPTIGMDSFTSDLPGTQTTTRFTPAQTGAPGAVIGPGGVPGFYEDVVSFTAPATAQPTYGVGDPMGIARENVVIGPLDLASPEVQRMSDAQKAQRLQTQSGYLGGAMQFGDSIPSPTTTQLPIEFIQNPTARGIVTTPDTTTSVAPVDDGTLRTRTRVAPDVDTGAEGIVQSGGYSAEDAMKALSQDERYKDVFNEDGTVNEEATEERAKAIIDSITQGQSTTSKVNMKKNINFSETPTEGRIESFDRNGNLVEGGNSLYIYRNGEWIYRGERGNLAESDADFFARLDDQTEAQPSAQPSAPGATSQFPIASSFQPTINQFGQPVVQATGQPIQEVMRAPTTYGEVLGGTPMQPMTTTGGFYDDLYQQSLEPVDAFMAYQLSQFPGASLGSRLAAQDALGSGFEPAFGRFLLGSASGRITPDFETPDASGGFGRYLRDRQRADLSQVRQEFANLGAALRGYTPGGALDPRFASYYETFGDPSRPESLRNSILNAAQAALGTRRRTGALGNIYDVMQQQYGAGAGSRFADFVSGAFAQRPMVQPMQSFASPTSNFLAQSQSNPYYGVSATSAMARQQPIVTPEPTLFGGTMGY